MKKRVCVCLLSLMPVIPLAGGGTLLAAAPAADGEKLVAPVYPGAARISPPGRYPAVFAVKDPHGKVEAFYLAKHARMPQEGEGAVRGDGQLPLIVQGYQEVVQRIVAAKGDVTSARATEVFLEWQPEMLAEMGNAGLTFIEQLKEQAKKHKGHDAELAALEKKYDWMRLAWYQDGKLQPLISRCTNEAQGTPAALDDPKAMAAIAAQIQKLAAEGRYEEMAALSEKSFNSPDQEEAKDADGFALWKGCLEEAAGFAYLTRVSIDRDPGSW